MRLETKYRVFRLIRYDDTMVGIYQYVLNNENQIEYSSIEDAEQWLLAKGYHEAASHDYVIMPCIKVVKE